MSEKKTKNAVIYVQEGATMTQQIQTSAVEGENVYVCFPGELWTSGTVPWPLVSGSQHPAGCLGWRGKAAPVGPALWKCPTSLCWQSFPVSKLKHKPGTITLNMELQAVFIYCIHLVHIAK